ncbi:flagellar hook-associated protein FlgK [Candidatus Sumerlaeota bacterium]|nr:flagellar hook-associated protein FlgK [Candidatus Sumerlaeota bacterium]
MSLLTTLNIGRQGLYVSQIGLQVTGQNVANVNTPGYRRQRLNQVNLPYGLGVTVQSVERQVSPRVERQLLGATADYARSSRTSQVYGELEELFNEVAGTGLDAQFQDFFRSLQDLTVRPGGVSERETLRSQGDTMGHMFNLLYSQLSTKIAGQDAEVDTIVSQVNGHLRTIASLNRQIGQQVGNVIGANELKNERDELVRQVSELVPVTVVQDENGAFNLFIEGGMPLVVGVESYQLEAVPSAANDLKRDVYWVSDQGARMDVTSQLDNSALGGVLRNRDEIIPEQLAKLDRLAAEFVLAFNAQHRAGTGLDGVSGRNFFETLPVYTHIGEGSSGNVGVSASSVVDETLLTLHDYEIRFTGPANYDVVDATTGATIASGAYVSGGAIVFDGISVTIGDFSGPPVAGDVFRVDTVTGASGHIEISAAVAASLDAIAAGLSAESGDNRNALALADMETAALAAGGTMSFRQMYLAMVTELGVASAADRTELDSRDAILNQVNTMFQSVSGVNIDEEATKLIEYQRAYEASSKVISVADEMMQTLLSMI